MTPDDSVSVSNKWILFSSVRSEGLSVDSLFSSSGYDETLLVNMPMQSVEAVRQPVTVDLMRRSPPSL